MRYASLVPLLFLLLAWSGAAADAAPAAQDNLATPDQATEVMDRSGVHWAERTLSQMSLEEKVGQLLMIKAVVESMNPAGAEYTQLRDVMQRYHLGGFLLTVPTEGGVLTKASPLDAAALTNQLQRDSPLPLIFAADFERGLPMRFHGGTGFPHAMAFGATGRADYAYQFGRISAEEARALGIHWNFYPDADVNSNPANPIINTRAFGEDPTEVGALASAFIRGVHDGGGLSTAKHFPGHGDTDTDSHLALSRIAGTRERLDRVELAPFRAAVAAGVDSVMVGHLLVPALEPDPNRPATVSYNITTHLLRDELRFQGIVVTDAMDMNGVTRIFLGNGATAAYVGALGAPSVQPQPAKSGQIGVPLGVQGWNVAQSAGRAAVEALKAGADLILIPADLDGAYSGILDAVKSGELSESRIDQSASRLLSAKAALGLQRSRFVDLNAVLGALARPENLALAQQVADDAVTIVRQGMSHKLLPLLRGAPATSPYSYRAAVAPGNHLLVLVFTDDVRTENGRALVREIRWRVPDGRIFYIDDALAPALAPQVLEAASRAERIVAALYVIPAAGRVVAGETGSPALAQGPASVLASVLQKNSAKTAVVALGNPYLITQYPEVQNYVCTFSNAPVSELSAVKFLFGEIPARGHLPITIPGVAERVPMAASH